MAWDPFNRPNPLDRFFAKVWVEPYSFVEGLTPCWIWIGGKTRGGKGGPRNNVLKATPYASFWVDGHTVRGHKWIFEIMRGPVPADKDLDHKCDRSLCVNPFHLQEAEPKWNKQKANKRRWDAKKEKAA